MPRVSWTFIRDILEHGANAAERQIAAEERGDRIQRANLEWSRLYDMQMEVQNGLQADFDGQARTIAGLRESEADLRRELANADRAHHEAIQRQTAVNIEVARQCDASINKWKIFSFLLALCLLACGYVAFCGADARGVLAQVAYEAQLSSLRAQLEYLSNEVADVCAMNPSWQVGTMCITASQLVGEFKVWPS